MRGQDLTIEGSPIKRTMRFDEAAGKLIVQNEQPNVNDVLAMNAALRNADRASSSLWGGKSMVLVGRIPLILCEKWHREGIPYGSKEFQAKVIDYLNDRDYSQLRTAPGRI